MNILAEGTMMLLFAMRETINQARGKIEYRYQAQIRDVAPFVR